ncbi:MAG: DUF3644 domain-containing protein [Clostridia bacterium]|nr:DUF3644 domain-containing protein [Clostridia bacterium]
MSRNILLDKSKEAMLSAVQIYNSPTINFKSETFIVLSMIAWTYLLHAYFKKENIEYRYYKTVGKRKVYSEKGNPVRFWELEKCLNSNNSPIDDVTNSNLKFLLNIRHEIEHKGCKSIDNAISAKCQACCLNYATYIEKLFGNKYSILDKLSISLQFSNIDYDQINEIKSFKNLPRNIRTFIESYEENLDEKIYNDSRYSYRLYFTKKIVNSKGQSDNVVEFISENDERIKGLNSEKTLVVKKEVEKTKYTPTEVINKVNKNGYEKFGMHEHTQLWKSQKAKGNKWYGAYVSEQTKQWLWYDSWVQFVLEYCKQNKDKFEV